MLFQPKSTEGNANDPYMINPKGFKVQIPEERVAELLAKGFVLVDKKWRPSQNKPSISDIRDFPLPIEKIKEELVEVEDILEVTEL